MYIISGTRISGYTLIELWHNGELIYHTLVTEKQLEQWNIKKTNT